MRIAHVTATFPPYYGGTGNVCYHNARVLAARGHDVHVFTAAWPGEPDNPPGVTVHRLKPIVRVGNAPVLPQLLRLNDFDLVHLHYPFYSGAEFVALGSTPFVVTYHQDVQLAGLIGHGTRIHGRTLGRRILKRAARFCPTSLDYLQSSVNADLIAELGERIVELPNGVDATEFQPGNSDEDLRRQWRIPEDACVALFVGAMDRAHYFKGIPTLLSALQQVPDVYGLLVGDGDMRAQYLEQARELGLADRICFAGRVAQQKLPDYYRAADFLVLPSESRGEAFGMVLLEALSCGRPVIASDLPGVRSVVSAGQDGYLTEPGNVAALAASLRRLTMMPPAQRRAMGQAGRKKVEQLYGWDRIGERLETLYADVVATRAVVRAG